MEIKTTLHISERPVGSRLILLGSADASTDCFPARRSRVGGLVACRQGR